MSDLPALLDRAQQSAVKADGEAQALAKLWAEFGRAVRRERDARAISIRKMAVQIAVSKSVLHSMECGETPWTVAEAKRAIRYFEQIKVEAPVEAIEVP